MMPGGGERIMCEGSFKMQAYMDPKCAGGAGAGIPVVSRLGTGVGATWSKDGWGCY